MLYQEISQGKQSKTYRLITQTYRLINGSFLIGFKLPTLGKPISTTMKTIPVFFTLLFVFSVLSSFSQEQVIKLKMEEGHEYIFEKVDKIYGIKEDKSKDFKQIKEKKIRLITEKVTPGNSIEFSLQFLKNSKDESSSEEVLNRTDYFFPNFNPFEPGFPATEFIEPFSCKSTFKFSFNLVNNEISLLNRAELFEQFYAMLKEQLTDDDLIKEAVNAIGKRKYLIDDELISFLTCFNNSELEADQKLVKTQLPDQFIVRERKGDFLNFGDDDFDKIIPGKTHKKYWLNLENGLIINYSTLRVDSIKSSFIVRINKNIWEANETDFRLLYTQKIPDNKLLISGKIEKPLSNKVHIRILDEPFDVILKTKTVLLDEKGSFTTSLDYLHAGFVYVENENNNKHNPPATYVFYAEPGDTIHFESTGKELPWNTIVSGNRIEEQLLIQEIRRKIRILESERRVGGWSNELFDREISLMRNMGNGRTGVDGDIEIIFSALENAENIISGYRTKLTERSFRFISNEVSMYFYTGIFQHAWISFRQDIPFYYKKELFQNNGKWKVKIDNINIHDFYNDYGLHSRECVHYYLRYHFSMVQKVRYIFNVSNMTYHFSPEPEMDLQFARIVLTGSPLYREIAANLTSILEKRSVYFSMQTRDAHLNEFALKNLDLLKLRCNDLELVEKVNQIVSQHQELETGKFVPEIELLDINHNKVAITDFLGKKPTIFYFSQNWINDRYEYDDMAKATPAINFVMVVEGSNFEQWQEYTNAADPSMIHLLYINDKVTFRDIFQAQQVHMVFNKEGEYIGNARNAKQALKLAQDSLTPKKKELNKSQLIMIIWALGILFTIAIIVLGIWKWRVRQRFRREQQQRRLRELELTAIRSQMNPHFLFNSLNSVQNLVQQNKGREAHLYLADFAGLIRKVLQNSEKEEVSLAEELEMTEQYLNLEKLRFDFDFSIGVEQGIDIHNTTVPSMLLQPFAENAVIHGLQNKPENRKLKIEVVKKGGGEGEGRGGGKGEDKGIVISIEDNGIGRDAAAAISKTKNGKGSKLIQERLEILQEKQGEKYRLEITDLTGNETGTRVEIFIPEEN